MADVKALSIVTKQIENFKKLPAPPGNFDAVNGYSINARKVSDEAQIAVTQVVTYIRNVEEKLQELREAQSGVIKSNQAAIHKIFEKFQPGTGTFLLGTCMDARASSVADLQLAHELEKISQELMNDRLNELIRETEVVCAKVKDGATVFYCDVEELRGCLQSWEDAKAESFEEEKRKMLEEQRKRKEDEKLKKEELRRKKREEEQRKQEIERRRKKLERKEAERKKKEEDERKRREMEDAEREAEEQRKQEEQERQRMEELERKMREEAEQREKEEEERKRREREEAERKAEEERTRIEAEEIFRKEDELRRQREEEERLKREEEEKRKKLDEERIRRQKEVARKREEERQRLEAERRERERLRKEAEERASRQDPNNWNPVTYERNCDEVDGKRAYHGGINCVMISPNGGFKKDDLECNYSDEVDSIIEILENDEKPVSSFIEIQSKKGKLHSEVPSRIYIPHYPVFSPGDETVVKINIDGNEWVTISPEQTTSNMCEQEKMSKRLAGVQVNDFSYLKAIVVSRPRCQTILVDKPGVAVCSSMDKNVKLFVPRDAFRSKTELKFVVQSVSDETLARIVKENSSLDSILDVRTMITLSCAKRPGKAIEIDLIKASQKQGAGKYQRGKSYQLVTTKDNLWKFGDVEFKGNQDDLTVTLPAGKDRYTIMELEMPSSFPKENVLSVAQTLCTCINTTVVRMIARQHENDLTKCAVRIVRREQSNDTLAYLTENGYTEGPGESAEFTLNEGQQVEVLCTGNIESASDDSRTKASYLSYMGGTATDMTLRVKDSWKQKDLPTYVGSVKCVVHRDNDSTGPVFTRTVDLTISLPKPVRPRTAIGVARIKFPYYLTTLAFYLSQSLCKDNTQNWQEVLKTLLGDSEFSSWYRIAKRKSVEINEESVCRAMLLDWMKTQAVHDDKLSPIIAALKHNGNGDIAQSCTEFVRFQKENLSDAVLSDLAKDITKDVKAFGKALGVTSKKIEISINKHPNNVKEQYVAVLSEWRESEDMVKHGDEAVQYLRNICV